ncbi:MAG TPA: helix-turn-helix transcriptional regulator [Vicinamibacterales bacterium]|nr:helix-turn-helix transcriptional regulator [Vicinamibacterales bacterium]
MEASFGTRLRQQRERRGVELAAIAEQTKIKRSLLEALERDDLKYWPTGVFRRSWVRNYAQAIGADADAVVRELCALYPEEEVSVEAIASALDRAGSESAGSRALNLVSWLRGIAARRDSTAGGPPHAAAPRPSPPLPPASPFPRREPRPELGDAARTLGAVGVVLWSWDARCAVLRPSLGDGYPQAVMSALPNVPRDAENAVAAAFRRAEMCVVTGRGEATGALALPVMAPVGCVGVLALEFRNGVELRESVRAGAARLAADVVTLVVPAAQHSSVA